MMTLNIIGIMVTYNRPEEVVVSLRLLRQQERPLDHLFVIDNSTVHSSAEYLARNLWRPMDTPFEWVRTGKNLGPAGGFCVGMNLAMRRFESHDDLWLLFLDDDDPVPSQFLVAELEASIYDSGADAVGVVGSVLDRRSGRLSRPHASGEARYIDVDQIGSGRFPAYRANAISQVGPVREDLFFGREDLELGLRLKAGGFDVRIDRDLFQKYAPSLGKSSVNPSPRTVPVRGPFWHRTTVNHLRILHTYIGRTTAARYALSLLCADIARLVYKALTSERRIAWRNLLHSMSAVAMGTRQGMLSDVHSPYSNAAIAQQGPVHGR
jgi:glycosyltransferase involved in cell wall biosynthesis